MGNKSDALNDIAAAIREQTEYFREADAEDRKDTDKNNTETWGEEEAKSQPHPDHSEPVGVGQRTPLSEYRRAYNVGRRVRWQDQVEFLPIQKKLLQEIMHEFVTTGPFRYGQDNECKLCGLSNNNPVHRVTLDQD